MTRPTYMVFAGVNGSGKSTLYGTGYWTTLVSGLQRSIARVNPDEILFEFNGSWDSQKDQLRASKEALRRINELFEHGRSFNQETTLCGRMISRNFVRAKDLGYRIVMFYVGVNSADLALSRIEHRVSVGGHNISEDDVRRRFDSSIENFERLVHFCDDAVVLDNTREFKSVARWTNGTLSWCGNLAVDGSWFLKALLNKPV